MSLGCLKVSVFIGRPSGRSHRKKTQLGRRVLRMDFLLTASLIKTSADVSTMWETCLVFRPDTFCEELLGGSGAVSYPLSVPSGGCCKALSKRGSQSGHHMLTTGWKRSPGLKATRNQAFHDVKHSITYAPSVPLRSDIYFSPFVRILIVLSVQLCRSSNLLSL